MGGRVSVSTRSDRKYVRWFSGSHSCGDGGNNHSALGGRGTNGASEHRKDSYLLTACCYLYTSPQLLRRGQRSMLDRLLEGSANLPNPDIIAQEIVDDLEAALE